tara:strand:- start:20491 stop:21546 length:1056 start_codon:yes stop_codon:yes gene_type:complete
MKDKLDLKKYLVLPSKTIRQSMQKMDDEAIRTLFICDANLKLLGVITDGDIRRSLLKGIDLDSEIMLIVNTNPITASKNENKNIILERMRSRDILMIPIVNDSKKLLSVETINSISQPALKSNPIFIMAGGFGKRLKPFTDKCPKPMLQIGDKPLLEHIIINFKSQGFVNFYISTHFMPDTIKDYFKDGSDYGVDIKYVYEETPLGTGGALSLLPNALQDSPLVLINGDILTKINLESLLLHHEKNQFDATICVRELEHKVPYGVISVDNFKIKTMTEKPSFTYMINSGIYVLNKDFIDKIESNKKQDLPTILEKSIKKGKNIGTFTFHDYWLDIGQIQDYEKAQRDISNF